MSDVLEVLKTARVTGVTQSDGKSLNRGLRVLGLPRGPIKVPRAHDPSGLRQESRALGALGATISGMRLRTKSLRL